MKIAFVQKCPSNINFAKDYKLDDFDVFNLHHKSIKKLNKRDVTLEIATTGDSAEGYLNYLEYDYLILIGSEAVKMFSSVGNVTDYTGKIVPYSKKLNPANLTEEGEDPVTGPILIASMSPAMLRFKPEAKPVFERTVDGIHNIISKRMSTNATGEGDYTFFTEEEPLVKYLRYALEYDSKYFGLDTETGAFDPREGELLGVSISHKKFQGVYAHADCFGEEATALLQELIDKKESVLHNAKFDMHFLNYHLGMQFEGRIVHDTMIIHYLLDERAGTHGLKSLTLKYGHLGDYELELDEFKKEYCAQHKIKQADFSYAYIPWDTIKVYAAKDTDATITLFEKFYPVLCGNPKLLSLYENLMQPALHFLFEMERNGVPLHSLDRLKAAQSLLDEKIAALKEEMYSHQAVHDFEAKLGNPFNPNSVVQLRGLLFDELGLEHPGKLTDTGALSTDEEVLTTVADYHPLPRIILEIKKATKIQNTYITKLIRGRARTGYIHTGFNLTTTTSGRLSSSGKFNMQQLPRDNPIVKGCVVPRKGYKIVAADLTTAEVYYAAVLSGDKAMQQVFVLMQKDPAKYPDFHSNIAHMVFGLPCEPAEVKKRFPALRQAAKAITFGILYGSGAASVSEQVNLAKLENGEHQDCTKELAQQYIKTYFSRFPQLKRWIDSCHNEIRNNGYIYNFFGRKRRLLNINSADRGVAAGEVRSGFNAIIQSVSSDHLLLGALETHEALKKNPDIDARIFALVHDSVVAEVREDCVDAYGELLVRMLQKDRGCSIPGYPVGVEFDSEEGGSEDYSCGKLQEYLPELAKVA
jgi:DNA polymerase I-like protein with 3'-5' exonuclease and polymerase domains